jgi:hypothetical protein
MGLLDVGSSRASLRKTTNRKKQHTQGRPSGCPANSMTQSGILTAPTMQSHRKR